MLRRPRICPEYCTVARTQTYGPSGVLPVFVHVSLFFTIAMQPCDLDDLEIKGGCPKPEPSLYCTCTVCLTRFISVSSFQYHVYFHILFAIVRPIQNPLQLCCVFIHLQQPFCCWGRGPTRNGGANAAPFGSFTAEKRKAHVSEKTTPQSYLQIASNSSLTLDPVLELSSLCTAFTEEAYLLAS